MTKRDELLSELGYVKSQLENIERSYWMPGDTLRMMWEQRKAAIEDELRRVGESRE